MKITKRQLRRIIKEEKAKLVTESMNEGWEGDDAIGDLVWQLIDSGMSSDDIRKHIADLVNEHLDYADNHPHGLSA